MEGRLAAILHADVVAYSCLMQADEAGIMAALKARRRSPRRPAPAITVLQLRGAARRPDVRGEICDPTRIRWLRTSRKDDSHGIKAPIAGCVKWRVD